MTVAQKKDLALQVIGLLEKQYPDAKCSLEYSQPHELLIATRLSAQCTDARVNIVTKELFAKFHTIEEFADADIADIEEIVKPCGLYKTKAKSIKEMCIQLRDEHGGILPDTLEGLTKLSGIGRKTANLIMGDIYHKPAVVTDTHCIRITGRLGLVKSKEPAKVEAELWKILPPDKSNDLCQRLVLFGREFCTARSPKCGGCPLRDICVSKSE
jgi:endonuclease-3